MAKSGPKGFRIKIDWDKAYELARVQCTQSEIAGYFGCTREHFLRRHKEEKGEDFVTIYDIKKESGKCALRAKQFELAEKGDKTMLVWLGKQLLEQKDEQRVFNSVSLHQQIVDEIEKEKKKEQK